MQEKPHDRLIESQFYKAGIPKRYHAQDRGLHTVQTRNAAELTDWIKSGDAKRELSAGGTVEWFGDCAEAMDEIFMTARSMTLQGVGIHVLSLSTLTDILCQRKEDDERIKYIRSCKVLAVLGFTCDTRKNPIDERDSFKVEWFLRDWIFEGRSLIVLNGDVMKAGQLWSKGFCTIFERSQNRKFSHVVRS